MMNFIKKNVFSILLVVTVSVGTMSVIAKSEAEETKVTYDKVFIGEGGTAFGAISDLNEDGVDVNELLYFFEEQNGVDSAGYIETGFYYVPILK